MAEIKNELSYYGDPEDVLRKSNAMIVSRSRFSSSLAYDLFNIGLTRIEAEYEKSGRKKYVARIYPTEINRLVGKGNNIYRDLQNAAAQMTGATIMIESEDRSKFECIAVITRTKYENYILEINYNEAIENHIFGLSTDYSTESIAMLTVIKKLHSKRIYEVLNASAYKIRKDKETGVEIPAEVTYRFREFLYIIGICDINSPEIQSYLSKRKKNEGIDYDYIYEHVDNDAKYKDWQKFKDQVLRKAQDDLKKQSNISFEFEGIKEGRSVKKIKFYIYSNVPDDQFVEKVDHTQKELIEKATDEYKQLEYPSVLYPELYDEFVGHNYLTSRDIDILLADTNKLYGNYDEDMVRRAIGEADKQPYINNYVGWIRTYIKNKGYDQPIEVVQGSSERAEVLNDIVKEKNDNSESIAIKVWEKTKQKEEFGDFITFIEKHHLNITTLETIYTYEELVQMFADYKLGRKINF